MMHSVSRCVSALTLLAVLAGCGSRVSPLTQAQTDQWRETNRSAGRSQTAAREAQVTGRSLLQERRESFPMEGDLDEMIRRLQGGQCHFSQSAGHTAGMKYDLQVTGASCPISADFRFSGQGNANGGSLSVYMEYLVREEAFRRLNDVYAVLMEGGFTWDHTRGSGRIAGHLDSVKHGRVPLTVTLAASGSEMEMTFEWEFKSYNVQLRVHMTRAGVEYTLNGSLLTADQFQVYLKEGGPLLVDAYNLGF